MTANVATGEAPRKPKRTPVPLNGVNTPTLLATIEAVGKQPPARQVRVPRQEPLGERHAQPDRHVRLLRRRRRA